MSLLEQFDYLRNSEPTKRLEATVRIFAILDIASKPVAPVASVADLQDVYGADVQYTFTRLVRGLASSRESARLGFSAALSELLRALPKIECSMVLEAIEKATTPAGNIKGQEIRDYQFGRLFGLQALSSSGLLYRPLSTMEDVTPVIALLYELALSKGWLRESCASVIIQILESLAEHGSPLTKECATTIHEMLHTSQLSKTIEGVAITLKCLEYGSETKANDWSHGNVLHEDNLSALNRIMRDLSSSDKQDGGEDKQTGTWKPKLHMAWMIIIRAILSSTSSESIKFPDLWRIVVDEGLFSASASHERKFWGFQLFNILIAELPAIQITTLFSPNLLRTLGNQSSQNDRYLNKAAKNSLAAMVAAGELQRDKILTIIFALWDFNFFFDRLSKDKTCESLMVLTPATQLRKMVQVLIKHGNPPSSKKETPDKEVEKRRQFLADILLSLLRSSKVPKETSWINDILDFFTINGYFKCLKPKKSPYLFTPELSDETRRMFQTRLQSALGLLMPTTTDQEEEIYVAHVVGTIYTHRSKKRKYFDLLLQPDETILSLLEDAEEKIFKLEKKRMKPGYGDQALAFILLYSLTVVQIYAGEGDAIQVLEDLNECYLRMFKNLETTEPEQGPMEVMVDLLLSFLARESVLFRKLVHSVFSVFAPRMTRESIQLLLNVLTADESGQALFDKESGEEDEGDDVDSEDEDEDMIAADEAARSHDTKSDDEESEGDQDSDQDDFDGADAERDAALDAALSEALNQHDNNKKRKASEMKDKNRSGHESDFEADSDEEEDLMDDDQMLAMDAALENIFKRRKQEAAGTKKQDRTFLKTSTIGFKRKVVDLLDLYIKTCPTSPLILELILPLLQTSRTSSDAQLSEKIHVLIRQKLSKIKTISTMNTTTSSSFPASPFDKVDHDQDVDKAESLSAIGSPAGALVALCDRLRAVHAESLRASTPPHSLACSAASLLLVRLAAQLGSDPATALRDVVHIYADTQLAWIGKRHCKLGTAFFVDFVNWCTQWRGNRLAKQQQHDVGRRREAEVEISNVPATRDVDLQEMEENSRTGKRNEQASNGDKRKKTKGKRRP